MRSKTLTLAFVLTTTPLAAAETPALTDHQWRARPVVVFEDADGDAFDRQLGMLSSAQDGAQARDVVVIAATADPKDARAAALRRELGVAAGRFAVVLVGKDGGVKFRSTTVTAPADLFRIIDAMPMRQSEMRK